MPHKTKGSVLCRHDDKNIPNCTKLQNRKALIYCDLNKQWKSRSRLHCDSRQPNYTMMSNTTNVGTKNVFNCDKHELKVKHSSTVHQCHIFKQRSSGSKFITVRQSWTSDVWYETLGKKCRMCCDEKRLHLTSQWVLWGWLCQSDWTKQIRTLLNFPTLEIVLHFVCEFVD